MNRTEIMVSAYLLGTVTPFVVGLCWVAVRDAMAIWRAVRHYSGERHLTPVGMALQRVMVLVSQAVGPGSGGR